MTKPQTTPETNNRSQNLSSVVDNELCAALDARSLSRGTVEPSRDRTGRSGFRWSVTTCIAIAAAFAAMIFASSCDTRAAVLARGNLSYPDLTLLTPSPLPAYQTATDTVSGVKISYRVRSTAALTNGYLEFELNSPGTGWVAAGFAPDSVNAMIGANFIIGFVAGDSVYVRDDYGHQTYNHQADTAGGGTSDIYNVTGSETANSTTIHVVIPLNSGDSKDKVLLSGVTYNVLLAYSETDDFSTAHGQGGRGSTTITIP